MERAAAAAQKAAAASKSGGSPSWSVTNKGKTTQTSNPNYRGWTGKPANQEAINAVLGGKFKKYSAEDQDGNYNVIYSKLAGKSIIGAESVLNDIREQITVADRQLDPESPYNKRNKELAEKNAAWIAQGQAGSQSVSVSYNGSTVNMNNDNYVKTADVNGIVNTAVNAMQNKMTRSSSSRLAMGLS